MFHIFICRMMEHIQSYLFVVLHISERFSLQTQIRVLKKYTATSAQPDIPPALLHARSSSDLVCSATLVRNWGDLQHLYYPHMRAWLKIHCPPKRRDGSKTMNFAYFFWDGYHPFTITIFGEPSQWNHPLRQHHLRRDWLQGDGRGQLVSLLASCSEVLEIPIGVGGVDKSPETDLKDHGWWLQRIAENLQFHRWFHWFSIIFDLMVPTDFRWFSHISGMGWNHQTPT